MFATSTHLLKLLSFLLASALVASGHPVIHHHFNKILEENPCLKGCMDKATAGDIELSILKTANISGYLESLDEICSLISAGKDCISGCGVDSNPFALESMNALCEEQAMADAQLIGPCLAKAGDALLNDCKQRCGDYDFVNEQALQLTKAFQPRMNDAEKVAEVLNKVNEACGTLKCSHRCFTQLIAQKCSPLSDERSVAEVVQALVERVLYAQRRDLDRMQLADTMAQSVPIQCNYMYMPDVMFNTTKDELALAAIDELLRNEHRQKQQQVTADLINKKPEAQEQPKKELNFALSQLHAQVLHKQMQLLTLQEHNLRREAQKIEYEFSLLNKKYAPQESGKQITMWK